VKIHRDTLRRRGGFALTLLALLALLSGGCTGGLGVEQLYSRATHAAYACKYAEALALTERCLDQQPDHVKALILHSYCRYRLLTPEQMRRDSSTVVTPVEKAARLAPQDFMAQYFHGWMLFEAGQYGRALEPLERAYDLRSQCPDRDDAVLVMLSMCCVNQNLARGRTYLQALRRFRGLERSALVYNAIGVLNVKQQDYQGALGSFMEATRRDPNHAVVLMNLAVLYDERLQRPDESMRYYNRAIAARQAMRDSTRQDEMRRRLKQLVAAGRRPASGRR
jgi:tetratricopeptide (TPR) repeat protein